MAAESGVLTILNLSITGFIDIQQQGPIMPDIAVNKTTVPLVPRRRLLFLFLFVGLCAPASALEKPQYRLAVVPQLPPLTTHKNWTPFVERLEQETGLSIRLTIYKTIPDFEVDVLAGKPDFAFMNPYHQVMAKKARGYMPLVRNGAEFLYGIVVVARDGPIKNLKDLDGKEIAFPAPNAYAASLYVRALLSKQIKIRFRSYYLDTHSDVYRHVILGKAAAGGAVNTTLMRESADIRAQLRVLYKTPPSAPHPLSAHPRGPARDRRAIQTAVLRLGADPANRELLQDVLLPQPVKADYRKDYQALEKLGLEKFVVPSH